MSYNNKKNRIEERVYSVTMTEEELKLFSEFLSKSFGDTKLSDDDEEDIELFRKVPEKNKEKLKKELQPENILVNIEKEKRKDPETMSTRDYLSLAGTVAGAGGLTHANFNGYLPGNEIHRTFIDERGREMMEFTPPLSTRSSLVLGGLAGSLIGSGVGYGVEKIQDHRIKKRYRKNPNAPEYEDVNKQSEKMQDKLKIAEGKMTREEYAKKHGIKKSDKKKREF